jgi:hypothetical protein
MVLIINHKASISRELVKQVRLNHPMPVHNSVRSRAIGAFVCRTTIALAGIAPARDKDAAMYRF